MTVKMFLRLMILAAFAAVSNSVNAQKLGDLVGIWSKRSVDCKLLNSGALDSFDNSDRKQFQLIRICPDSLYVESQPVECEATQLIWSGDVGYTSASCLTKGEYVDKFSLRIEMQQPNQLTFLDEHDYFSGTYYRCTLKAQCISPRKPVLTGGSEPSVWDHNGSSVILLVDGDSRKIIYKQPRLGMLQAGAEQGSVLFKGKAVGDNYFGTAYVFSDRCGANTYNVSGPILDNGSRIILQGQAPRVDRNCRIFGYKDDRLEFRLLR